LPASPSANDPRAQISASVNGPKISNKVVLFESCSCTGDCRVADFSARRWHFSPELRTIPI